MKRTAARDADATRGRILAAATAEFARYGLGGARVDRIAERASANKRMLYYYFKDKEGLFLAALEDRYSHIRSAEQGLRLGDLPPPEALRRLVAFTWNYYLEHPEFVTLLNSENLHKGRHMARSSRMRPLHLPLLHMLRGILMRGAREGLFRRGIDPMQLYISIAAEGYFYLSNRYTLSRVFGRDLMTRRALREREAHIIETILNSVRRAS